MKKTPEEEAKFQKTASDILASRQKDGFENFMKDPLVQVLVSIIPPGETQEALPRLLESTYRAGFGSGTTAMMEVMMKMKP